jgi:hypothetical protein
MPIPYRKTPRAAEIGQAAFVDVAYLASQRTFYGALLILDGKGRPMELVHNTLIAPSGPLWSEEKLRDLATVELVHSLFDACRREPDLLVCRSSLGSAEFCRTEIASAIPLVQVTPATAELPAEWSWINDPPSSGIRASILAQELERRGFITEPFERLWHAMRILYPDAAWREADDETVRSYQ